MCVFQKKVCFLKNRMFFLSRVDEALQLTFVILMFLTLTLQFTQSSLQNSSARSDLRMVATLQLALLTQKIVGVVKNADLKSVSLQE